MLNKDYKDVIKQYDSKDTLCYIDPHYVDANYYGHKEIDPEDVAKIVKTMKGKAIISYNNHPAVRKAFAGLNFHKVNTRYELQKSMTGTHKDVSELLITNF
jgi:DNA adenine methylase